MRFLRGCLWQLQRSREAYIGGINPERYNNKGNSQVKTALVTGGSGAIGSAICRALAAQGLKVIVHANHRLEEAQRLAAQLQAGGATARAIAFDVTDREATARVLAGLGEREPVQVLVNNAGV